MEQKHQPGAATKIDAEFQPEAVRHSLKFLPKREAHCRIQNLKAVFQKKNYSFLVLDASLTCQIAKKKCEYFSIENLRDENKKLMLEELNRCALNEKQNKECVTKVDVHKDRTVLEGISIQNKMIQLRDQLSNDSQYREGELLAEMDELRKEMQDVLKKVMMVKMSLATENMDQIMEDINDNMKQIERLNSLLDIEKSIL